MIDFIIEGMLEVFSEIFFAIFMSKPLCFIERNIKNEKIRNIVQILILLLCTLIGVIIAIGLVIEIIAIIIYISDK